MIRGSEDQKLALSFSMVAGKEAKGLKLEDFQHLVGRPSLLRQKLEDAFSKENSMKFLVESSLKCLFQVNFPFNPTELPVSAQSHRS